MMPHERFRDLLERHGADFGSWPDAEAALAGRELVLSDREAHRLWSEARRLDQLLSAHLAALDEDAGPESVGRVVRSVAAAIPARRQAARWHPSRIAAGLLIAALLGGAADRLLLTGQPGTWADSLALESLLYGPLEVDLP